jgi:putative transposase
VFIRIQGVHHYLWRAQLIRMALCWTSLFQPERDANAAKRFFKRLLKGLQIRTAGDRD